MRIKVPMTGTVIDFDVDNYKKDSVGISGDPADPVRPIALNLGVPWKLVSINLDDDTMEIEIEAPENISVPAFDNEGKSIKGKDGKQVYAYRPTGTAEKQTILNNAKALVETRSKEELYQITGERNV